MHEFEHSSAELIKERSQGLRGTVLEELALPTPGFSKESVQILKFHGVYPQDDRDARKTGAVQRGCLVRVAIPGGVLTAGQYLERDRLAGELGEGSLRVTTRQDIQYHRVRKTDLSGLLRTLNERLLTTLAACGDVVRNVTCCPAPSANGLDHYVRHLSAHFKPRTRAYYEIWIDGQKAAAAEQPEAEPLYGAAYLPRKFKIGFAMPGDNCIDIYSNDVGVVPVYGEHGLERFVILAG